jgi:peptidoglycan hydrolase CwlO-like protein
MAKYLLIAAIVISLVTAGLGFVNHQTLVDTKTNLDQTKTTLIATQKSLSTTQTDLKTTKATLDTTSAEKVKLATDLQAAQTDLTTTKGQLDEATKAGTEKDTKIADLQTQIDEIKKSMPTGPNESTPKQVVDQLNQRIQELEAQVNSFSDKAKADTAVIADLRAKEERRMKDQMKEGLEGRVLAVNPAWNFVVLSIGDKQGVTNNAEMLLKRGGQYLGKVRITSVEPATSIADIVANTLPDGVAVQPGDSVIYQSVK